MATETPKPQEITKTLNHKLLGDDWMNTKPEFRSGMFCHPVKVESLKGISGYFPREWKPTNEDWKLPADWKSIVKEGIRDRLVRFRSFQIFMDICVRCGACADKCHFFIGTGDPKNMPVLRAELIRSVYRGEIKTAGKILGKLVGGRKLTEEVIKEWFYYFFQCTECRRCSVFCPYGIDTAEITIITREILNLLGLQIDWIGTPVNACYHIGNHLGLKPHTFKENIEYLLSDIEENVGITIEPTFNRKGAEILFITPSGDVFADPGIYTCMAYLIIFEYLGLDYTWSTYASEGGNFGFFTNNETMKRLNYKIYAESKRLGVKWILGGECGHMWRVIHQYMDTMNGPADHLEVPKNPITGTIFNNAKSTKIIHITEFIADLIKNKKIKIDKSRNDHYIVTWHDSCNTSRGMGFLEEPRYVLKNIVNNFYEMPEQTIREQTFCCGSGSGLNAGENLEQRFRGGLPRANAVQYVREKHGVNMLANICAIDRASLKPLMDYWVPGVNVCGLSELVANALVIPGEKAARSTNLRGEEINDLREEAGLESIKWSNGEEA